MATKKASSPAPAAAAKKTARTKTSTKPAAAKKAAASKTTPPKAPAKTTAQPEPIAAVIRRANMIRDRRPAEEVSAIDIQRGLKMQDSEFGNGSFDDADAVDKLTALPEYALAIDLYRGNLEEVDDKNRAEDEAGYLAIHSMHMFRAGWLAAMNAGHPDQFLTASSIRVYPPTLNTMHGSFLLSMLFAFCSNEELPYGQEADITPMPHQSNRAGNQLIFRVGTSEFVTETASRWTFKEGDWLEINPHDKLPYHPGDLAAAIVEARLTLVEIRRYTEEGKDEPQIGAFELRQGKMLDETQVVLLGPVRSFRRSYFGPDTAEDKELDTAIQDSIAADRAKKGGGK